MNIEHGATISRKIYVGNNSWIGINAYIQGETHIGDYVMMGPDCCIWTINHESSDISVPMSTQGSKKEKTVYIGNDVRIGSRVMILLGVHIGNGVINGAGAVVSKYIPDMAVAVGNPAQII